MVFRLSYHHGDTENTEQQSRNQKRVTLHDLFAHDVFIPKRQAEENHEAFFDTAQRPHRRYYNRI
jgi:hypothetical protein